MDLGVFQRWTDAVSEVQSPEDLCRDTTCDPLLLGMVVLDISKDENRPDLAHRPSAAQFGGEQSPYQPWSRKICYD